jgi:hypothetical protein
VRCTVLSVTGSGIWPDGPTSDSSLSVSRRIALEGVSSREERCSPYPPRRGHAIARWNGSIGFRDYVDPSTPRLIDVDLVMTDHPDGSLRMTVWLINLMGGSLEPGDWRRFFSRRHGEAVFSRLLNCG